MLRLATWKVASILGLVFAAMLLIIPSFMPADTVETLAAQLPSFLPVRPIVLGLDLQGGAHLLMEVDSPSVIKTQVETLRDDVRGKLREGKISISGGIAMQPRGVLVRIADPAERDRALRLLQSLDQRIGGALSGATGHMLDIADTGQGAIQVTLTEAAINDKVKRAVGQSIEVLNRRLNGSGTKETNVQQEGSDRVLIEVPGLQDTSKLKDLLGATAKLEFRLVADAGEAPGDFEMLPEQQGGQLPVRETRDGRGRRSGRRAARLRSAQRRARRQLPLQPARRPALRPGDQRERRPSLRHRARQQGHFGAAHPRPDHRRLGTDHRQLHRRAGQQPRGAAARRRAAGQAHRGRGAHGRVPASARIRSTRASARPLSAARWSSSTCWRPTAFSACSPTSRSAVHILFIFASMALLGATLTLPGIAGIVFTIGMAVDSNVLIYERIREESHLGRTVVSALEQGFNRAFATIIDSNVTMFVAAAILYLFGSGAVRGFAVSLGLGILTSVITAVTMTRMMIALWYRNGRPRTIPI